MTDTASNPLCECHGKPMAWTKEKRRKAGGVWRCRIKRMESVRAWEKKNPERASELNKATKKRLRDKRRDAGVCTECGGPLCTEACCWDCLNRLEASSALSF